QLYSFMGNAGIFLILHYILKKKTVTGTVFFAYLMLYGLFRFLIEFLRGDPRGPMLFGFSTMQFLSVVIIGIGLYGMIRLRRSDL
ncbi:MAG: prolipoprotein diacylglyceryl transferase, partial [Elusimicrobia bacterium]|nr:prolipoprotein diacylglyceryl transferase [Elusimicrobiota bacterium]